MNPEISPSVKRENLEFEKLRPKGHVKISDRFMYN